MAENFTLRVDSTLMEKIDGYAKSKGIKRAEAFRDLIKLGLSVHEIRKDDTADIEEEFRKLLLEIFIRNTQQYLFSVSEMDKKIVQNSGKRVKEKIKENYPLISEKYDNFLFQKSDSE